MTPERLQQLHQMSGMSPERLQQLGQIAQGGGKSPTQQDGSNPLSSVMNYLLGKGVAGPIGQAIGDPNSASATLAKTMFPATTGLPSAINRLTNSETPGSNPVGNAVNMLKTAAPPAEEIGAYTSPSGGFSKAGIATGALRGELGGMSRGQNPLQALPLAGVGAVAEPAIAGISNLLSKRPPALSFKGLANQTDTATAQATDAGQNIPWEGDNSIKQKITDAVVGTDKNNPGLGDTPEVRKALNNLFASKDPGLNISALPGRGNTPTEYVEDPTSMSPDQLLQWRRSLQANMPTGLQGLFQGGSTESKVNGIARQVISQQLHGLAPDSVSPDKWYSIFKKMGGDVPQWATKIIAASLADATIGKKFGGIYEPLVDLGVGALAGRLPIP